jgi:hypothetical protein
MRGSCGSPVTLAVSSALHGYPHAFPSPLPLPLPSSW